VRGRETGTWRQVRELSLFWTAGGRKSLPSSEVKGIRRTGEDIKESYNFFFENHAKLSHPDVSLVGTVSRSKKEKELTR
jgi:tmRNA-binding protein